MRFGRDLTYLAVTASVLILIGAASAGDWPMWRCTTGRTAATPETLPKDMALQWALKLPAPESCWPSPQQHKLEFDLSYEPVAADGLLFVPSMVRDGVSAYDAATGERRWRFFTDGPVRFAPAVDAGKLFIVSDDGYLYCLDARTGALRWRLRGGPSDRKLLGNGRLISMWPARGAPVVADGTVYFAAGIWPFMGIFVSAVSAETGEVIWRNTGNGSDFILQPHSSPAFAGVAPQGHLAVAGDLLVVPGGRSVPAVFERKTGKLVYYNINDKNGGYAVAAAGGRFLVDNCMYNLADGGRISGMPIGVVADGMAIGLDPQGTIRAHELDVSWTSYKDQNGAERRRAGVKTGWTQPAPTGFDKLLISAGTQLVLGGPGKVAAMERPGAADNTVLIPPSSTWSYLAGQHPQGPWTEPAFDASAWKQGKAGFGYGDNDDATVLDDMRNTYTAVYIRKEFVLDTIDAVTELQLKISYDDSFIAYLNGKEVLRVGVGEGSGANARGIKGHEAKGQESFRIEDAATLLRTGVNVLAVEGHNSGAGSSDFSLHPVLELGADGPALAWQVEIEGTPWSAIAADGRLFVVTREGTIACFGSGEATARVLDETGKPGPAVQDDWAARTSRLLEASGKPAGYCLVLGAGTGRLAEELVRQSNLNVTVLEPEPGKIASLRDRWTDAGIYGRRLAIVSGDIASTRLPKYLSSLITAEDGASARLSAPDSLARLFDCLRPYGGTACFAAEGDTPEQTARLLERAESELGQECQVDRAAGFAQIKRPGPLPDSAPWTHHYADVANSVCSKDGGPRPPLGLLWFGGTSHTDVLPRHGHGPSELVGGGRLFIQGIGVLSARDVYTGRPLWRREFPRLDTFDMYYNVTYNPDPHDRSYNQRHIPGANDYGSNVVIAADRVYLVVGPVCLVLDPETGNTLAEWRLPALGGTREPNWGYIGVYDDLLIAGAVPYHIAANDETVVAAENNRFGTGSKFIVVLNRRTGDVLWQRAAGRNFRHNAVVAGKERLFCIDALSPKRLSLLSRRGVTPKTPATLLALDVRTGRELWRSEDNVSGTWLGYSEEFDVLLEASARAGDRARDETGRGMAGYRGMTGERLWRSDESYAGPCILYHDRIITQTGGGNVASRPAKTFDLLTGKRSTYRDPLTGRHVPWEWVRFKGCNTAVASEHLLTFRSASGCYIDLTKDMGTVSIGGFKSGCTSNMIAADGVLNVPDYTRTCTCSYQNQTSFALIHMPPEEPDNPVMEAWSFDHFPAPEYPTPIQRVGINLAAPGNRRDAQGTLWLESPSAGGPSPDLPITIAADDPTFLRHHMSSLVSGPTNRPAGPRWVAASGIEGITSVSLKLTMEPADPSADSTVHGFTNNALTAALPEADLKPEEKPPTPRPFTVRLHFAELADAAPGERVFDVSIQGKKVLRGFDIAKAAGEARVPVMTEFKGVDVSGLLRIDMGRSTPGHGRPPLLCGIEILGEHVPLNQGYDGRIAFSAPNDIRCGQAYALTNIRLRSGQAVRGVCRYRHDGETQLTALPLERDDSGSLRLTLPGALTGTPFAYCLELQDADGHTTRAPYTPAFVRVVPDATAPGKVTELTVTDAKSYRMSLAWQPATDDCRVVTYRISRTGPAADKATAPVDIPAQECHFTDRDTTPGRPVTYQVRAIDGTGRVGAPCSLDAPVPANTPPVNGLTLSAFGDVAGVTLRWQGDIEEDVTGLEILRGSSADGDFAPVHVVTDRRNRVYTDSKTGGRECWYKTRLRDSGGLVSALSAPVSGAPLPLPTVFLSDLKYTKGVVGWSRVMVNRNAAKKPCRLGGKTYAKGLGVHAKSLVTYELKPEYRRFVALVGVDDMQGRAGSVEAIVNVDGKTLLKSTVLHAGDSPFPVNVAIPPGSREITLIVTDAGDGIAQDLVNWAGAGFVTE